MKEFDEVMKTLADGLRSLAVGISAIAAKVDDMARERRSAQPGAKKKTAPVKETEPRAAKTAAQPQKKTPTARRKPPAPGAAGKPTGTAAVLKVISESADGADMALLKEKTGFSAKMIANILYKLKKQNKVKSLKRGVYVKA